MRNAPIRHPSDNTLILALEGDLPSEQALTVDAHLAACDHCRLRSVRFKETLRDFQIAYTSLEDPAHASSDYARTRLAARLTEAAAEPARVWTGWRRLQTLPVRAVVVAFAIAVIAVSWSWRRGGGFGADSDVFLQHEAGALPVPGLTPGAVTVQAALDLCPSMPWPPSTIPASVRALVVRNYKMEHVPADEYELDYLITPDLGGSPDPRNLWPEPYGSRVWNARVKDQLEDLLPRLVCEGAIDLTTAQRDIASNWIAAYKKYFKTDRPLRSS